MIILFVILIIIASIILSLFVLIQNPKGGGLSGTFAGIGNQFMGVKQTTDVLEKGTWVFSGVIAVLCLLSVIFISRGGSGGTDYTDKLKGASPAQTAPPANQLTLPQEGALPAPDSGK